MKSQNGGKNYVIREIELSDCISTISQGKDEKSEANEISIIGQKFSNSILDNIMKWILPSYLVSAYNTSHTIELLKEVDTKYYVEKINRTINCSVFLAEDNYRDECREKDLSRINYEKEVAKLRVEMRDFQYFLGANYSHQNSLANKESKYADSLANSRAVSIRGFNENESFKTIIFNSKYNIACIYSKRILTLLAIKGIPNYLRSQFWITVSGAKYEMNQNSGYFEYLLKKYPVQSPHEKQIDLDLPRTFPKDPFFRDHKNLKKLRSVLVAYARRNLSIGYVQGFNFIAGKLLKQIPNEEEVFFLFSNIIESKMPVNYYSELIGLMADVEIMIKLLYIYSPNLCKHLINFELFDYFKSILLQWFLSIFTHHFADDLGLFILDLFFIQGSIILLKIGYLIIKENEEKLMEAKDLSDLNTILYKSSGRELLADIAELKLKMLDDFILDDYVLNQNRVNVVKYLTLKNKEINQWKIKKNKEDFQKMIKSNKDFTCDPEWPICLYDIDAVYKVSETLVLRTMKALNMKDLIIEGYLDLEATSNSENIDSQRKKSESAKHPIEGKLVKFLQSKHSESDEANANKNEVANRDESFMSPNGSKAKGRNECIDISNGNFGQLSFRKDDDTVSKSSEEEALITTANNKWANDHINSVKNSPKNKVKPVLKQYLHQQSRSKKKISHSRISIKDISQVKSDEELTYEDVLIERRIHTSECVQNSSKLKDDFVLNKIKEKKLMFEFKGYESMDFGNTKSRNQQEEPTSSFDYMNHLKSHKDKAIKSLSLIYSPHFFQTDDEEADFNSFITSLKNKYNKITQTTDMCISLLEENRKQMGSGPARRKSIG